ncbi:1-acyl-sn-glycerol-3-phosphate acyltransferase [Bdellovibrionota bacterium FG-1]
MKNIPWFWKPAFWLYGYGLGLITYLYFAATRLTCRIELEGTENFADLPNCIMAMWHTENVPCFVSGFFRRTGKKYALINHPAWYMKPIHVVLRLSGVKFLILGSTGNNGKLAADELVRYLRNGWSTHINPDGPAGPPKTLKKGVAHIACQSGVPIIPVKFVVSHEKVLPRTWDGKRIPLPFSTIRIVFGEPIRVTEADFENRLPVIAAQLA